MSDKMKVVQCWDDGVNGDIPLIDVLRKHGAKATFNLNFGSHENERKFGRIHNGVEISKLGLNEMKSIYEGFVIANHGLNHLNLKKVSIEEARSDVVEGRDKLQQFFGQPIKGFAYANGGFDENAMKIISEAGHVYARTTREVEQPFPPEDPMAFHPNCRFLAADFWDRYEKAKEGGVFYFWGHSYEILNDQMLQDFDEKIKRITDDPESEWVDVVDLFE